MIGPTLLRNRNEQNTVSPRSQCKSPLFNFSPKTSSLGSTNILGILDSFKGVSYFSVVSKAFQSFRNSRLVMQYSFRYKPLIADTFKDVIQI